MMGYTAVSAIQASSRLLKTLLGEGLSEPEFYGRLVYKFKEMIGKNDFSFQFRKKSLHVTDVHVYVIT